MALVPALRFRGKRPLNRSLELRGWQTAHSNPAAGRAGASASSAAILKVWVLDTDPWVFECGQARSITEQFLFGHCDQACVILPLRLIHRLFGVVALVR
jgi:hypothetical protein